MKKRYFLGIIIGLFFLTSGLYSQVRALYYCGGSAPSTSRINFLLNLANDGDESIPLSELEVRYYFIPEGESEPVMEVPYAVIGNQNVTGNFFDGYLAISFTREAGSLAPGDRLEQTQIRIHNTDWSQQDQLNDYSFDATARDYENYTETTKMTIYRNGQLIWGIPVNQAVSTPVPTSVPINYGDMQVSYQCLSPQTDTDRIEMLLSVTNNVIPYLDMTRITIHYYYTNEGGINQQMVNSGYNMAEPVFFDNYLELRFLEGLELQGTYHMKFFIVNTGGSLYNQADDYSFDPAAGSSRPHDKITCYVDGQLVWGVEPEGIILPGTETMPAPDYHKLLITCNSNEFRITVLPPDLLVTGVSYLYYPHGQVVELFPHNYSYHIPDNPGCGADYTFREWIGTDVSINPQTGNATVLMDDDKTAGAYYNVYPYPCSTPPPTPPPTPQAYFVPQVVNKELLNLEFYTTTIPTEPSLFPPGIIVDFEIQNDLYVITGTRKLAAYGMDITFDNSVIINNTAKGNSGVEPGTDGFIAAVNAGIPGKITISGFDADGQGPGNLHLLTFHWLAQTYEGSTDLVITINQCVDETAAVIDLPDEVIGRINITTRTCIIGDIDNNGIVDIIDALLAAQYYVEILSPEDINLECGDVNCNGTVDIVDALLIAQKYVGLDPAGWCL